MFLLLLLLLGIPWTEIPFNDNTECISLLEGKPSGIFLLLDEECMLPKGSEKNFLEKLEVKKINEVYFLSLLLHIFHFVLNIFLFLLKGQQPPP